MAMLAEPKRKRKWSLNPRGKLWCNDDSKIGQKLLEKMGWAKGKGLGREEQGDLEPVRLKYKNDTEGVGFEVNDDQWIAHRDEFNNILEALNGNDSLLHVSDTAPVQSLEDRSKSSKARVHYHKFTRGKDLSRYSAADMACILGKRTISATEKGIKNSKIKEEQTEESTNGSVEHQHGVITIQRGSIQEYFDSKMAAVKAKQRQYLVNCKQEDSGNEGSSNCDDHEKDERRVRINEDLNIVKEFHSKEKILKMEKTDTNDVPVISETVVEIRPKKKKKESKSTKFEQESECTQSETLPVNGEMLESLEIKKKKKKNDFQKNISEPVSVEAEPIKTKKSKKIKTDEMQVIQSVEEDEVIEQPKKKKKKTEKQDEEVIVECKQVIRNGEEDYAKQEPKKKTKKSKKQEEEMIEASNVKVSKKSKKNKTVAVSVEQVHNAEDVQPPAKKKKSKRKKDEPEVPEKYTKMNDSCVEAVETESMTVGEKMQNSSNAEQQSKTKKAKSKRVDEVSETLREIGNRLEEKETKFDKQTQNETDDKVQLELTVNELDIRVSKKNKKNKEREIVASDVRVQEEITIEVSPTKKKAKKRKACENTNEVVINGEKDVLRVLADETAREEKSICKNVCSADQLTCQANAKSDDNGHIADQTPKETLSSIIIEAGLSKNAKMLAAIKLNDGSVLSQKLNRKLMKAEFGCFVGSNILSIAGYGSGHLT